MTKKLNSDPVCAVDYAFQRIGGKYKGRIIWYIHTHTVLRYGELKRSIVGITPKMLTKRCVSLKKMTW